MAGAAGTATLQGQSLIDPVLATGKKSGYNFEVTPVDAVASTNTLASFHATADPIVDSGPSQSGTRIFGVTEDGVMRGEAGTAKYGSRALVDGAPALGNQ